MQAADGGAGLSTFPSGCDPLPARDPDSTEVMTNTIAGDLVCYNNTPAAQVNPADGGTANAVGGHAVDECAGPSRWRIRVRLGLLPPGPMAGSR